MEIFVVNEKYRTYEYLWKELLHCICHVDYGGAVLYCVFVCGQLGPCCLLSLTAAGKKDLK